LERVPREKLFKKLIDICKRCRTCPYCAAYNGVVKKASGSLKIIHERYSKNPGAHQARVDCMEGALSVNEGMRTHLVR
jgi:DNA-directed RNA polymerase III subunit RPC1